MADPTPRCLREYIVMPPHAFGLHCSVCSQALGETFFALDHRVEYITVTENGGQTITAVHILNSSIRSMYCSPACWNSHESEVAAALQLQQTYPAFSFVTPCSRCAQPVNRTQPYICYSLAEMSLTAEPEWVGQVIDDHDYAVLCKQCKAPGLDVATTTIEIPEEALG